MKNFLTFAGIGILGLAAWKYWPQPEPPPPPPPAPKVEKVEFSVKLRVKKLIDEWKRLETQSNDMATGGPKINPRDELMWIKRHMFSKGIHDEASIHAEILKAMGELGYSDSQSGIILNGLIARFGSP